MQKILHLKVSFLSAIMTYGKWSKGAEIWARARMRHCFTVGQNNQEYRLQYWSVCLHCSLVHLLCSACFTRVLCCANLFTRSLTPSLVG